MLRDAICFAFTFMAISDIKHIIATTLIIFALFFNCTHLILLSGTDWGIHLAQKICT